MEAGWAPAADPQLNFPLQGQRNAVPQLSLLLLPQRWAVAWHHGTGITPLLSVPAGLLAIFTPGHRKDGRFMSASILMMSIVGPIAAGLLTSAVIAGANQASGKDMIPFEALALGTWTRVLCSSSLPFMAFSYSIAYTLMQGCQTYVL